MFSCPKLRDPLEVHDHLLHQIQHLGLHADEREEVAQEAWVELLTRSIEVRGTAILRLVALHAVMRLRSQDTSRRRRELLVARVESQPSVLDELVERSARCELRRLVRRLSEPYRTVVGLRYLEGCSAQDIGRRLERRADTVRVQLKRGLDLLRDRIAGQRGTEHPP